MSCFLQLTAQIYTIYILYQNVSLTINLTSLTP